MTENEATFSAVMFVVSIIKLRATLSTTRHRGIISPNSPSEAHHSCKFLGSNKRKAGLLSTQYR